ncbi:hypothetical protein ACI2L4_00120 [Streptomyces sparsogenes]|uniref:hypothetical protein n=1 Tax=Streptomyces sparsogenes TaxID=67365 RepID=UPI00384A6A5A
MTAVMVVSSATVKDSAGTPAMPTAVALVNPLPRIVTVVPPRAVPEAGEKDLMPGNGVSTVTVPASELVTYILPLDATAAQVGV